MKKIFGILVVLMMVAGTFVSCNMPTNDTTGNTTGSDTNLGVNFTVIDENEYVVLASTTLNSWGHTFSDTGDSEITIKCIIPTEFCNELRGMVLWVDNMDDFKEGSWVDQGFEFTRITLNGNQYYGIHDSGFNGISSLTGDNKIKYESRTATPGVYQLKDGDLTIKVKISSY